MSWTQAPDLFIYRQGAMLGWGGESPYSGKIAEAVKAEYPNDERLQENCGFFLPPQAVLFFGPFAALPWGQAKILYTILAIVGAAFSVYAILFAFRNRPAAKLDDIPMLLPWLVLVHPLLTITVVAGQTTVLAVTAILLGQVLHERGWKWAGAFFWAVPFLKPHVALVLLPLAWCLDDWKRPLRIMVWLAVLNVAGGLIVSGSPFFAFEYLQHLNGRHKAVMFNLIEYNPQITSWNNAVYHMSEPLRHLLAPESPPWILELTLTLTLAGYAAFALLVLARLAGRAPNRAWITAMAAVAACVCAQVLAYEACLLLLVVPLVLDHLEAGRKADALAIATLLVLQMLPLNVMLAAGIPGYRPILVLVLALLLLARPAWQNTTEVSSHETSRQSNAAIQEQSGPNSNRMATFSKMEVVASRKFEEPSEAL